MGAADQILGLATLAATSGALVSAWYVRSIVREVLRPPSGGVAWALARGKATNPGDLGLAAREYAVDRPGQGVSVPVWEIDLARTDDPGDPPALNIVLLHGWGRSRVDSLDRLPIVLPLAERPGGARLHLVDLRGHGDANGRTTLGTSEPDDLLAVLDGLEPGPIVLVGHSLGAVVAIEAARHRAASPTRPDAIVAVVAIAPYDTVRTPIAARLAARELPRGPWLAAAMALVRLRGVSVRSTIESARALAATAHPPRVLVVVGEGDRIAPPSESRAIGAACSAEILSIPEAEHADHHRRAPEALAEAIRVLVARDDRPSGLTSSAQAPANRSGSRS
jgi:pimeloyl-ACP methyl ester carboxylesterase